MRGHTAALAAAALVDGDIHKHRAVLHFRQILSLEELGRGAAGDEDRANDQVCVLQDTLNIAVAGHQCLDMRAEHVVQFFQALEVDVENRDVRAHADGNLAGVHAHGAAAENYDIRLRGAGHAGEQNAFPAKAFFQIFGAFLNGQTSGDLRHGCQAGQRTVFFLNGLIRDRLDFAPEQCFQLFGIRCKVQIGVEDQAVMEQRIFAGQRLLDLDHHVGKVPDIRGIVDQGGTRIHILIVRKSGADPGPLFHIHMMSRSDIGPDIVRGQSNAEFIVLDLFHASDFHGFLRLPLISLCDVPDAVRSFAFSDHFSALQGRLQEHRTAPGSCGFPPRLPPGQTSALPTLRFPAVACPPCEPEYPGRTPS